MDEVVAGSQDALAVLYDRHVDAVFATARRLAADRHLAEEVVQETFLTLWNRAELYDPQRGSLATWLRRIARNRALDRLRSTARRPKLVALGVVDHPGEPVEDALERLAALDGHHRLGDDGTDPGDMAVAAWIRDTIRRALDAMPGEERAVIVLAYDEELSQSEIAIRLGWPIGTVKTRTRRALRRLRAVLAPELATDGEEPAEKQVFASSGGFDGAR